MRNYDTPLQTTLVPHDGVVRRAETQARKHAAPYESDTRSSARFTKVFNRLRATVRMFVQKFDLEGWVGSAVKARKCNANRVNSRISD